MKKNNKYRISFLIIAGLVISFFVSRHFAIQNAIQGCDSFHLRALEQPFNIDIQINTYNGVRKILHDSINSNNVGLPVWLVTMSGKWTNFGVPIVEDEPVLVPVYFNQCTVIVNALTGHAMSISAK